MLFHSNDFLYFLTFFLLAYYLVQWSRGARNTLILLASYVFYGWWDYRFVLLLLFSSVMDFSLGLALGRCESSRVRKWLVAGSVIVNLGLLSVFKYLGFFRESLASQLALLGIEVHWAPLNLILPVGISFYTFQSLSYVIDVYRRAIPATSNPLMFLAYVSFFPQLVAGPIERATHMLPQFSGSRPIDGEKLERGVWLVLWGLFKKVVLADNFAPLADMAFSLADPGAPAVVLGTIAFAFQIYCDFSAYSDIARGLANLLGFELMLNFNLPYFAQSVRDFWRRWHISLSTWFRDYLYVPLGGNRRDEPRTYLNLGITMLLAGIWHGAALNFLLWGCWHGLGLAVNHAWATRSRGRWHIPAWCGWGLTMLFVLYGWLLFRALSLDQIWQLTSGLAVWSVPPWTRAFLVNLSVLALPLVLMQLWQYRTGNLLVALTLPWWAKALLEGLLLLSVVAYWEPEGSPFIYFQF
jgi:D-alanyl-lipoteichoic acid acyltransferase DltB (MBOAT superfamily)